MAALDKKALDELMIMHRARLDEHARNEGVPNVQSGQKAHPQAALITGIARGFAPLIHELEVQIKALSARVQELEARPSLKYLGTWKEGKTYSVGTFITDGGAVWYANASTTSRPVKTPTGAWRSRVPASQRQDRVPMKELHTRA